MAEWISECIKKQPKVGDALRELTKKIPAYEDAAKPSACKETGGSFWSPELPLFRPGWILFTIVSIGYGIAGIIFSLIVPSYQAGAWADLALKVTIPVFVIGISLVSLARSISESRKFAGEYLNDSCRTPWFCCLTLVAVLCGIVGHFTSMLKEIPNFVTVGICMASIGTAINCLAMLAFVVRETIRCSVPSESGGVVLRYTARKLTWGYLKEAYIALFRSQHKDYLTNWCTGKAIYPPEQYFGHYIKYSLYSGNGDNDVEIELDERILDPDVYKDYDLQGLEKLEKYLKENSAELYLSSPVYESERKILGILSCENVKQNEKLRAVASRMGRQVVKWQKYKFSEEQAEFWESHLSALETVLGIAIKNGEPDQVRRYLNVALKPLSVLRALIGYKIIADADNSIRRRSYEFIRFYLKALREILEMRESDHVFGLSREVRNSVWEETSNILRDMDYRTMKLYTWLVQQMYTLIQDEKEKGKKLREIRAQFGGFYDFASEWIEESKSENAEDVNEMRLVLHEGLSKWLLIAIEKRDGELIEQLCDAGRQIVFGGEGIKFEHREVVAQYLVLAGHLIGLAKAGKVTATAVGRLFCERHSHDVSLNFEDLVSFYIGHSLPLKKLDSYLRIFFSPTIQGTNIFTGSSHSTGYGMTGSSEISRTFIFLAAHALKSCVQPPDAVADMSGRIREEDINCVEEVFKAELDYFLGKIRDWIKKCDELHEEEETKEIAKAKLNEEKVEEHKRKFWEGYSSSVPVLSLCMKNGNYKIDNAALSEWRYDLPKIALIDWKYPISGADGDLYGKSLGRDTQTKLLGEIAEKYDEETDVKGGLSDVFIKAVGWLKEKGCNSDNGIVIFFSELSPYSRLYRDKIFLQSRREDVRSLGFKGFYDGFPIVWIRDRKKENEEEGKRKVNKPRHERVVAVDLRGWTGISVREDVVKERKFGELDVRMWKDEEIQQAVESGKLNKKDVDKAKCNCTVDVTFYWQFSSEELPRGRIFILEKGDVEEGQEKK